MKKIVLSALAVVLSLSVMAQAQSLKDKNANRAARADAFVSAPTAFNHAAKNGPKDVLPEWHPISQNVTATDINNNTISTASILASGKAMVIDFSAVWCSWCWVMHQNGILEAIHNQLGSQVEVMWVEGDPSTTPGQGLTGGTGSQGDWTTIYNTSTPVPYPVIDNASFTNIIGGSSAISGFPTVVFVSPTGYWCDVYGTDWGFGPYSASDAVTAITNLLNSYPQAGEDPQVAINAQSTAFVNQSVPFSATIVSVDAITGINWTFQNGTPATATGTTASASWATAGTYTVTCEVSNTSGTTTVTHTITIRDGWSWGDEMDYTEGGSYESAIGLQSGAEFEWGVLYPAELMTGRNYVTKVSAYINDGVTGTYTVRIYQGGTTAPTTSLYECPFNVTQSGQWVDFTIPGGVAINPAQSMWVTLSTTGYAASYTTYNQDPNSSMLTLNGQWYTLSEATSGSYEGTWMIKTTTSATQPTFDFSIAGPTEGSDGDVLTFTIGGPSSATYNWTFQNGTPATATGMTASASWATAGTYTVTVNGTNGSETASHTLQVSIRSCGISTLPYEQGFENDLSCWNVYDADGDGYTWEQNARQATHGGSGNIASASFMNGGVGALTPDNWLVSPKITIPSNGATIEWWEYGDETSDFADHYSVMASWNGNQPSDFTATNAIIFSGEPTQSKTWVKHSRSLAGFAGMDIYIAFRHHDVTNMFWLIIDDVKISAGNTSGIDDVEHLNVAVYPNPTTGRFHITAEGFENVEVFDVTGRNVMNADSDVIDLSAFANGVYTLRVNTTLGSSMQKIVKK